MHLATKRAARGGCYALAIAVALFALSGCAVSDYLRGPSFHDEPKIGRKSVDSSLTPNRGASVYGYSSKARQIEQNLGVE
jgi:hypothetical protein